MSSETKELKKFYSIPILIAGVFIALYFIFFLVNSVSSKPSTTPPTASVQTLNDYGQGIAVVSGASELISWPGDNPEKKVLSVRPTGDRTSRFIVLYEVSVKEVKTASHDLD